MISPQTDALRRQSEHVWLKRLVPYRTPSRGRAAFELAVTLLPFAGSWALAWVTIAMGQWWGLFFTIPAAAFLLRLFMIQHDCGHGSFFGHRKLDDWTGRLIGVLTLTPYDCWRHTHAIHHASSGNLDARGIGDVRTLTLREYHGLGAWRRAGYRLYRHPLIMFGIGPAFLFVVQQRLPWGAMRAGALPWASTMGTNAAIAAIVTALIWVIGFVPFLLIQVPIVLMAATVGVWLFYVQHQFEDTQWDHAANWKFESAALYGSSFYDLPHPLGWLTANVGIHHVHHVSSRVPFYRLPRILREFPELRQVGRITIPASLRAVRLTLWDESRRRLISFREARALA
jgi:omega-6 fatty acid desaturase (delta-12 desaturase)